MKLDVYNTHMELYPYTKNDYPILEDMFTAIDKHTEKEFPCGYIIEDGKMYLPRGASISKIESLCGVRANYIHESDPVEIMDKHFHPLYDPRDKIQEESIAFLKGPEHQLGLNLKTGMGKEQPYSTKIPTPKGYTTMGDIKVGDQIFGSDGNIISVTETFEQGVKDIYEITFDDGRKARCGLNHLWNVYIDDKSEVITLPLSVILNDYKTYVHSKDNGKRDPHFYKYKIPVLNTPVEYPSQRLNVSARSVGKYFGNTFYKWRNNTVLMDEEKAIVEEAIQDFSKIPDEYLYNSIVDRIEFLGGIIQMCGDVKDDFTIDQKGNTRYYRIKLMGPNPVVMSQIKDLVLGLGLRVDADPRYSNNLSIIIDEAYAKILIYHQYDDLEEELKSTFPCLTIKDIQIVGQEKAKCIMVDSEDHLYLTEDFIVTHNTFCVAYASTELNLKTMIITPNESLKQQWIKTYSNMFDYRNKHLMNIAGSNIIEGLMNDEIPQADVYFVNHQTLRSYMTSTNGYNLHKLFKKLNIGIKVYDESHMEFYNILLIDFFTNTDRTWYLTATFDRSDKTESACFKRAFNSVISYGEVESEQVVKKHVVYHVININSHISHKNRPVAIPYSGMTSNSYGKYAFLTDPNDTAYQAILCILDKTKNIEGKTLIFVPLIDAVDKVVAKLKKDFPEKTIAAYHSKIPKDEKEAATNKDIIVSTIKSCGTGRDIKGLRCVICAEPIASKVIATQVIGRLRPYAEDKDTFFFDICDISIPPINWWFRARFKKIQTLVKSVIYLDIEK